MEHLRAFDKVSSLWAAGLARPEGVIRVAADLVGDGLGGPALVEVASLPIRSDGRDLNALLELASVELDLPFAAAGTDEALPAALPWIARAIIEGRFALRALARWVHSALGHDGPEEAPELVELDDSHELGWDVDDEVLAEAKRLAE